MVLGPRGRGLGSARWPLTSLLALLAAIFAALAGEWWLAVLLGVAAVVLGGLTVRRIG
jgi:hypothetical protein